MLVVAPDSDVLRWGSDPDGVVVCDPSNHEAASRAARERGWPLVLCVPAPDARDIVAEEATRSVALRADAYASDEASFAAAVAFVRRQVPAIAGPRLTYLGSLGQTRPPLAPELGACIAVATVVTIGRQESCTICLRQGPHSDQNTVARMHARVEMLGGVARLEDLRSTNGTTVNGEATTERDLASGDEIAISWSHRFRFD